ncbi:MAG: hypothetical protein ACK559_42280, partial [bacterium]
MRRPVGVRFAVGSRQRPLLRQLRILQPQRRRQVQHAQRLRSAHRVHIYVEMKQVECIQRKDIYIEH